MGDRARDLGRWTLAGGFAVALALAFPFRAGDLVLDVAPLAGALAPLLFVGMVRDLAPRRAFLQATAAATLAYVVVLYWIWVVVRVHGHAPPAVAGLAVLALAFYVGLHIGAAAAIVAWGAPRPGMLRVLLIPSAWVVTEHLRGFDLFSGFPWALLGYSLIDLAAARALAGLIGVYGLSFLLLLVAGLLWAPSAIRLSGLAAVGVVVGVGGWWPAHGGPDPPGPPPLRVGIVQGNIPQEEKWDPALAQEAFDVHVSLSSGIAPAGSLDLIVWPEASVPVFLELQGAYREAVSGLASTQASTLLVGGVGVERSATHGDVHFFNSVFAVDPGGRFVTRYDKSRLVPFGEYVPLRWLLGFLSGLATGIASGDITPGPRPTALHVDALGPYAPAPLICYEVIYPDLVREAVRAGANVLVNVTNDAWYGRTSAPHQFLEIAAMRAAEHRLPMVRAANTGVSAIVDATGAVRSATPIFERRVLRAEVERGPEGGSPYTRFGDWAVFASWGILAWAGGRRVVGTGRRREPGDGGASARSSGAGIGAAEASLTSKRSAEGSSS